jgi:hypothetical protein
MMLPIEAGATRSITVTWRTRSWRDRVCHSQRALSHVKTQPTSMSICRSCRCPVVGELPCIFPLSL